MRQRGRPRGVSVAQEMKTLKARGDAMRCVQLLLDAVRTRPYHTLWHWALDLSAR
jgi:hypothetical protein